MISFVRQIDFWIVFHYSKSTNIYSITKPLYGGTFGLCFLLSVWKSALFIAIQLKDLTVHMFFSEGKCLTCVWNEEEDAVAVAIHCPIRRWLKGAMATSWNSIGQRGKLPWQAELRRQNLSLISLQAVLLWSYYFIPVCGFMFLSVKLCEIQPIIKLHSFWLLNKPSKLKKMKYFSSFTISFYFLKRII